ncbi:MAG: methionine--tRNA ligase, partial [Candidatus Paceibacterota bacterium]
GKPIETIKEKNYFFKLSKYQDRLVELIESDTYAITPLSAKNEALSFIKRGLEDFSISRSKERARGWGVEVPGNSEQFMYVWFDALNVYRSAAPHYWPADLHIIGKDILRFHAVYWPAMLLSAGEKLPKALFVHGFITSDGKKMSKSLGNVVDPVELVNTYGLDAVRYFLLAGIASDSDGDFSKERFEEKYTADLVNGLGNFAFRVLTLAQKHGSFELDFEKADADIKKRIEDARDTSGQKIEKLAFHDALFDIFELVRFGDGYLNDTKPWDSSVSEEEAKNVILQCLFILEALASWLLVFLPETSAAIDAALNRDGSTVSPVKPGKPFFARLEN